MRGSSDEQLDVLFRAYRVACPTPEPGPHFMPQLWQKIEARQAVTYSLRRWASAFVTAALAASVVLGVYMAVPRNTPSTTSYYSSYVEALADANTIETPDMVAPVRLDLSDTQ